ncbi:hypothetical protein FB567DRAFT_333659 [Paraphoma chrysanthemicola]|uniref:Uncharacterized protein n=1 Tax=Paraphoma chrysanthemicola TaxID=798071 RepID=A0A8K0VZ21_9PLEO|nr:hypothetical protein FB567DRAFT_333659 [Paraphoma chrysanthemicola]
MRKDLNTAFESFALRPPHAHALNEMAHQETPKTKSAYRPVDEGYVSDMIKKSRKIELAAANPFISSKPSQSRTFSVTSFEDETQWDPPASKARTAELERSCRALAAKIKKPTRFPLRPLESTLVRARAEFTAAKQRAIESMYKVGSTLGKENQPTQSLGERKRGRQQDEDASVVTKRRAKLWTDGANTDETRL